jgi:hypothetical protein
MSNPQLISKQRVRFEEVTPANTVVAFFEAQLKPLAAWLQIPIFDGYDDLDEMQFTLLTLPSGHTVTLQEYEHSPRSGVNLYVDSGISNISEVVFEACQRLEIPRSKVIWFHPDFQLETDRLYTEYGEIQETQKSEELLQIIEYEPIQCFKHALQIYTRKDFPEYWAMLQHNLGLAYFDRIQGDRRKNLEKSVKCFCNSLLIYTQKNFPKMWEINQSDLAKSQQSLEIMFEIMLKTNLATAVTSKPTKVFINTSGRVTDALGRDSKSFFGLEAESAAKAELPESKKPRP